MTKLAWLGFAAALVSLSVAGAAGGCGAGGEHNTFTGTGATSNGGSGATGTGGGIGGFIFTTGGAGGSCGSTCSADLKSVIDCNGQVVQTCPGDQACLAGGCSNDPCAASEAAKSSYGCDYYAVKPDFIAEGVGACFAAYVANTWSVPVHITVERGGQTFGNPQTFIAVPQGQGPGLTYAPYDPALGLPVGEVAIVFLSHDSAQGFLPKCPVPAALDGESGVIGTGRGAAFHITTDRPVVAYSILPYGGGPSAATSASLLLPTSAWDTNYVAVNAYRKSEAVPVAQPSLDVLAYQDNTAVTILPKVAVAGGAGVAGSPANTPITYTLNAGEYLQLSQDAELTGSPIQADKPIGLWGAASCLNVLPADVACDSAHQQIPPVRALGSEYAAVRYRNRSSAPGEETPPWRLVGAVDGTQLTWTPSTPPGAPTALDLGDVYEFEASGPFVARSQDIDHPFYMAQYMTGAGHIGGIAGEGDPEWVNVIPVGQYLDDYVFFTDPTYPETSLVVVRRPSQIDSTFADVVLDCSGPLQGWQPLGPYEYTRVDLVTGDFQSVNGCSNGRHVISSSVPFGVTVWGWGSAATGGFMTQYVSYAYPAGASVQAINEVVVPPIPN
ncbi:MAG: IgGFc-binding protein [Polyangiaceae bacterium]|nr:IgGFc-binding protein [Polyangiaceae bacterium]